jgi:phosphotransferase system enzyme I (PtsI)
MEIRSGIPVSPGVALGPAFVLDAEQFRIPDKFITQGSYPSEIDRLQGAFAAAAEEARRDERLISEKLGEKYGAVFSAHAMMIEDPGLKQELEALIRDKGYAAEYAVSVAMRRRRQMLESLQQEYFSARVSDVYDMERRILKHLLGKRQEPLHHLRHPVILLAHDLTPSETAELDRRHILAFATEVGGKTSHTAIMANVLEIPAVVGVGRFLGDVSGGDEIIVDGTRGTLVFEPDDPTRQRYEQARRSFVNFEEGLARIRDLPAVTKDGESIRLLGNIEFPTEVATCLEKGCTGVGLYRTEFLYLGKEHDPTEEDHFQAYREVVSKMAPGPVVIRTLDLGADKFSSVVDPEAKERNPFLGVRSIRICLQNLPLFKTQIRAILRASALGKVKIMFPMISSIREIRECRMIVTDVMEDLEEQQIAFDRDVRIGTMIEVPSAAVMADVLAREVDFFSIGTNDLIQYTLAADRTNENVAELYNAGDPAVLRLIQRVVDAAAAANIEVNVCGEMSGEPMYALLLVGMGLRQLSATPHSVPEIKRVIRQITAQDAKRVAAEALKLVTARDVNHLLQRELRRVLPETED